MNSGPCLSHRCRTSRFCQSIDMTRISPLDHFNMVFEQYSSATYKWPSSLLPYFSISLLPLRTLILQFSALKGFLNPQFRLSSHLVICFENLVCHFVDFWSSTELHLHPVRVVDHGAADWTISFFALSAQSLLVEAMAFPWLQVDRSGDVLVF